MFGLAEPFSTPAVFLSNTAAGGVLVRKVEDKSFTFVTKTPPAAVLLKKAAGVEKGSGTPNTVKVATVTKAQVQQIAETKMEDLNASSVESAMRMIEGTARSMGFTVEG